MSIKNFMTLKTARALAIALLITSGLCAQPRLAAGDLLFMVVADTSMAHDLSAAIVQATSPASALPIDHVAIVCPHRGKFHVIEAIPGKGVRLCPLDTFLVHADHTPDGKPLVLVGRIAVSFDKRASLRRAKAYMGRSYDDVYSPTDDDIYCSELVQKSFVDRKGNLIFSPEPMSFHNADGDVLPYWTEFYSSRGLPVPEGEPGSNPSALARHPAVRIIGQFFCESW
jgi:hypothetical protein